MPEPDLTPREREILLLAAEGKTDKEIAERLGVGRGTVATHWTRMRERTGAASRAQAVALEMGRAYREAEADLLRTSGLYGAMVESLEDVAVYLLDLDRKVTTWNPGVGRILGYEEAEWVGHPGDMIFTPEDRAEGAPDEEQATAMREGRALDDRWHVRRDGSRFWASGVTVVLRDGQSEPICLAKILRDLTRLKRLESRLAELGDDPRAI